MANIQIGSLPTFTAGTDGVYLVMNDSGNTQTYKVAKETLISGTGGGGTHFNWDLTPNYTYSLAYTSNPQQVGIYGDAVVIAPFTPGKTISISAITADIYGTAAGGEMKYVVYSHNTTTNRPDTLLIESTIFDLSILPFTIRQYNVNYTFQAGTTYWLGMAANAAANGIQMRGISTFSSFCFGVPETSGYGWLLNMGYAAISAWPTLPAPSSIPPNWATLPEVRIKIAS